MVQTVQTYFNLLYHMIMNGKLLHRYNQKRERNYLTWFLIWKGQVNNLAVTSWRGPLDSHEEAFSLINSSEQRRNVVIMYVSIEMRNQKFCFIRSFGLIAMVRHHISNNCHTSQNILLLLCLGFFPLRQFLTKRSHKLPLPEYHPS